LKRLTLMVLVSLWGCDMHYKVGNQGSPAPQGWCATQADCPSGDLCAQGLWRCDAPPNCSNGGPCQPYCGACVGAVAPGSDAGTTSQDSGTGAPDGGTPPAGYCATPSDCPPGDICADGDWQCLTPPWCGVCLGQTDGGAVCGGGPTLPVDAGLPAPAGCGFKDAGNDFPLFAKCCATAADCSIGVYEIVCCGQTMAVGINNAESGAFAAALADWQCAGCACALGGERSEDGKVSPSGTVTVSCDNGWCTTHGQ
jgi:hypothetical protein